jgi:hypothetical protein
MNDCGHAWDEAYEAGTTQEKAKNLAFYLAVELLRQLFILRRCLLKVPNIGNNEAKVVFVTVSLKK